MSRAQKTSVRLERRAVRRQGTHLARKKHVGSQSEGCRFAGRTLVWIDDYEPGLCLYKAVYEKMGYRVYTASRGADALNLVAAQSVDVVIVDYEMPQMNGGKVATALKRRWPTLPVILFSGSDVIPKRVRNLVDALCDKASPRERLVSTIQTLLSKKDNPSSAASSVAA